VQRIVAGARTPSRPAPTIAEFAAVAADPLGELEGVLRVHTDVLAELEALCRSEQRRSTACPVGVRSSNVPVAQSPAL
jgi:hypothetical protein